MQPPRSEAAEGTGNHARRSGAWGRKWEEPSRMRWDGTARGFQREWTGGGYVQYRKGRPDPDPDIAGEPEVAARDRKSVV